MKTVTKTIKFFFVLASLAVGSNAFAECYSGLSEVAAAARLENISSRWVQTDANDNKPVTISLRETGDGLFVTFIKDGNVLTEGNVQVCTDNNQLILRPIGQLTPGPNAPEQLRDAMTNRGTRIRFTIPSEQRMNVRISVPVLLGASMTMPMTFQSH